MLTAIAKRILFGLILLIAVVVLNFLLIRAAPGDVVDVLLTQAGGGDPAIASAIRAAYGLDQPVHVQLYTYLGKMLTGDLGYSYYFDQPVLSLILSHLPVTVMLVSSALLLGVVMGTLFGIIAALRPRGASSHLVTVLSLFGYATPVFWLGMMVLLLFAQYLMLFPAFGFRSFPVPDTMFERILDQMYHLALPVFTLSILYMGAYSRLSRASMLDVLGSDYIRTARSKGLPEYVVVLKHALKNAALPIVTIAGMQVGAIFSGAVLVETVFSLPGIGPLLYESILRRDYPVVLGVLFGAAVTTVVANIITDLVYRLLDPRIRGIS